MSGVSTFEVVAPGIMTSVQDLGRFGQTGQGVSSAGALDQGAFRAANRINAYGTYLRMEQEALK